MVGRWEHSTRYNYCFVLADRKEVKTNMEIIQSVWFIASLLITTLVLGLILHHAITEASKTRKVVIKHKKEWTEPLPDGQKIRHSLETITTEAP